MDSIVTNSRRGRPNSTKGLTLSLIVKLTILCWLMVMMASLGILTSQPWLGMAYKESAGSSGIKVAKQYWPETGITEGTILVSIRSDNGELALSHNSVIEEPDRYPTYKQYDEVFQHNTRLAAILNADKVWLMDNQGEEYQLTPVKRSVLSLPVGYWILNVSVLVVLLVSVAVRQYRPGPAGQFVFIAGLGYVLGMAPLLLILYRGLGLDPNFFLRLSQVNHLGIAIFSYSIAAVLLIYPRQLVSLAIAKCFLGLSILVWLNIYFRLFEFPHHAFFYPIILIPLALTLLLGILQWILSKGSPVHRAVVRWYVTSLWVSTAVACAIYFFPTLLGQPPVAQTWVTALLPAIVYIGFVLGVARYKLFDLDQIWLKSWVWLAAGAMIVGMDLVLVGLLQINQSLSLGISILLVAWIYLPLRHWIWSRLTGSESNVVEEFVPELIQSMHISQSSQSGILAWQRILAKAFDPLTIEIKEKPQDKAILKACGEQLWVPILDSRQCLQLTSRNKGSKLFSNADVRLVDALLKLKEQIRSRKEAYDLGVKLERDRMMRDLHDDVGSKLLSLIYQSKDNKTIELGRETLGMLRETVYAMQDSTCTNIESAVSNWQEEIKSRLDEAKIESEWKILIRHNFQVSPVTGLQIARILRELITNVIKHSTATKLKINTSCRTEFMILSLIQDNHIESIKRWQHGAGLSNIENRLIKLNGKITRKERNVESNKGGELLIRIFIPVPE